MNLNICIFILPALLFISGCGKSKIEKAAEAEKAAEVTKVSSWQSKTADTFKDPSSVQFRKVTLNPTKTALCGEVNAKNSFGAYTGFRPFVTLESEVHVAGSACSGNKSNSIADLDADIACLRASNVVIRALINNGCTTQEELNKAR